MWNHQLWLSTVDLLSHINGFRWRLSAASKRSKLDQEHLLLIRFWFLRLLTRLLLQRDLLFNSFCLFVVFKVEALFLLCINGLRDFVFLRKIFISFGSAFIILVEQHVHSVAQLAVEVNLVGNLSVRRLAFCICAAALGCSQGLLKWLGMYCSNFTEILVNIISIRFWVPSMSTFRFSVNLLITCYRMCALADLDLRSPTLSYQQLRKPLLFTVLLGLILVHILENLERFLLLSLLNELYSILGFIIHFLFFGLHVLQ